MPSLSQIWEEVKLGRRRSQAKTWHVPVTEALNHAVEEAIARGTHSTKTELVREAVREKLRQMGFLSLKPA